ncbi:MAG: biotin/lipoyl-binding protein, partial [Lentisphaeraceae bacterium]|nr:biotin/lipoyl-binding protein [Lentisphaeraceae bacterium]
MKLLLIFLLFSLHVYSQDLEGVTTPSADVSASFTIPALVEELKVKEGQFVKKGDILAIQQKQVEEQQLVRLRKEATATALIDKANVEIDYYTKDVESLKEALLKGASSKKE